MLHFPKYVCEVLLRLYIYLSDVFIVGNNFQIPQLKYHHKKMYQNFFFSPERIRNSYLLVFFNW